MSESDHPTEHTRPYTVGVSIAVVLIFLIAILHVWSFIFKKIKKRINKTDFEIVEIPVGDNSGRKIYSARIQQLDMVLTCDDEVFENDAAKQSFQTTVTVESNKNSKKGTRHVVSSQKPGQSIKSVTVDSKKIVFFAGYSHHYINDAWPTITRTMGDIWNRMKFIFCPKMKNNLKKSKNLQKLMVENQNRAQNQIARIANHNLIDKPPKIFTKEIEVYQKFISLKPSMCDRTLQEII